MKRYELADGMLQFLNIIAWIAGGASLVAAVILVTHAQVLPGVAFGLSGVVSTVTLLAFGHVGRVIIDIAVNTSADRRERTPLSAPLAAPTPSPQPATSPVPRVSASDERSWRFLKEVDPEVAAAAQRVSTLGPGQEEALAERLLVLGDRSYLPAIEKMLTETFEADRRRREEATATMDAAVAEASQREVLTYRAVVEANGGLDPKERQRVVDVQPYAGRWVGYHGGVKASLEGGGFVLSKGGVSRSFESDPDLQQG